VIALALLGLAIFTVIGLAIWIIRAVRREAVKALSNIWWGK